MNQQDKTAGAILVVDDCALIRQLVSSFLQSAGYRVFAAGDGETALSLFDRHRTAIDLVLTDVEMPGMSGVDLADRVMEFDGTLPVLFMSGSFWDRGRGYGCVEKPFRSTELIARIGAALERSSVPAGRN